MDGTNWFSYCGNDPVNYHDRDGKYKWKDGWVGMMGQFSFAIALDLTLCAWALASIKETAAATAMIATAASFAALSLSGVDNFGNDSTKPLLSIFRVIAASAVLSGIVTTIAGALSLEVSKDSIAATAVVATSAYTIMVLGALIGTMDDE